MSEKDREYVSPARQPSTTPSIPSLQPAAPIHHLSTAQRLKALHRSVQQCGFTSLGDALHAELLCVDRRGALKRAVAFYSGSGSTQLLMTIASSKRFNRQVNSAPEFKDFTLSFMTDTLEREIDTLACSKDSQSQMKSFTPEHIEKFTLKLLDAAHRRHAPLLCNLLHRMTKADQYPPGLSSADDKLECDMLCMPIGSGPWADVRGRKAGSHQESHQRGRRVSAPGMTEAGQLSGDIPQRGLHVSPEQGGSR